MILEKIVWVFKDRTYSKLKDFNEDVRQYQIDILGSDEAWQPNEVVVDSPQVEIEYDAWIRRKKELLRDERLSAEYANLFDEEIDEEDGEEAHIIMTLTADNNLNFTMGELFMKINNNIANKDLGDHVFFEGLEESDGESNLPSYYIYLGS